MQRFRVHIEGRTFDGCHQSYLSRNKRSGNDAQMTVKRFMKKHFNRKH